MRLASGMTKMYILQHFDWAGSIEDLEELDKNFKKLRDGSEGVEFLGRYSPQNKKFHWTFVFKAKDFKAWTNKSTQDFYKRDFKELTHAVNEYYV